PAAPASSAPAAAPAGSVSTDGVCGLVPISKVNSIINRRYSTSSEVPLHNVADAAYCLYGTAASPSQFAIQVATSNPADFSQVSNDATGDTMVPQTGIGDSAMFSASFPELLVTWGQTTVAVGQTLSQKGDAPITLDQLEKLATAVHAAG
ncbi:MAG TPA: hypothetical protein VN759_08765, partial [Pseudolysinimonas sp.]|nr:hypothetical protein [Pseudolysinimonas sp.]